MVKLCDFGRGKTCSGKSSNVQWCYTSFCGFIQWLIDIARCLIVEGHAAVNQAKEDGGTPHLVASFNGHIDMNIVLFLVVEAHAAINQAKDE